ncbi:hypothetical protein [Dyadobacter diqingensis]|uniref:hypothetical protein n=1 Tax=Dyadobacter diqingensis TaxID=2938121 RepID=UPI0020C1AEAB|nr:hypothetical protein [Dyadobacter diqingensis]
MKISLLIITVLLIRGCTPEQEPITRANNFDIVLTSSDQGDRISLRRGLIEYHNRHDVGDVPFMLDSVESDIIFKSVPWNLLQELPTYYEPSGKQRLGDNFYEIQFINGSIRKTIKLSNYADFGDQAHTTQAIKDCIGIVHKIVRPKSDVKPLLMLEI